MLNLLKIPSAAPLPYLPVHIRKHWHWGSVFGKLHTAAIHHACASNLPLIHDEKANTYNFTYPHVSKHQHPKTHAKWAFDEYITRTHHRYQFLCHHCAQSFSYNVSATSLRVDTIKCKAKQNKTNCQKTTINSGVILQSLAVTPSIGMARGMLQCVKCNLPPLTIRLCLSIQPVPFRSDSEEEKSFNV